MSKKDKIKAVVYYWNTKNCYTGFMTYNEVKKYVNIVRDQSMNRVINDASVDLIVKYMKSEGEEIFFPPVIMNSSTKIKYDSSASKIELEEGSLTIIDGQHRIKAINEILSEPDYLPDFGPKKIPFLIIEELSPEIHRKLFHTINDKSTKVQNNVSDRFSTTTYNLIGLKYVSENLEIKDLIEWEGKQSKEKIVYSHMLNCIELMEEFLESKFKNTLNEFEGILVENTKHFYNNEDYYIFFSEFWDYIFNKLNEKPQDKSFYVKEIALSYITKKMIDTLNNEALTDDNNSLKGLKDKVNDILDDLLPKELLFDYVFRINKSSDCNESLSNFLNCNKWLLNGGVSLKNKSTINRVFSKIIPKIFLDTGGYFSVTSDNYEHFKIFIETIDKQITDLLAQNKKEREIIRMINEDEGNHFYYADEQAAADANLSETKEEYFLSESRSEDTVTDNS
ncbi:DGQHR domain-containing protein [Paenibacillus vini]|uniref:DGQHR domain-containing protein n=1 Tax=Paenibacillus vini TaxID=1476024 RepID=A0ABQ4M998_9BACL|nr:DGQHR domain-containing protein [Paenibacillus vini]GIP52565.1 hypothetical protein J42TS3_16000 [Paenibacillus vini]